MFLGGGGYWGSVAAVGFCAVGRPADWFGAIAPGDVERVAFLAGAVRHGGFQIGGAVAVGLCHLWGLF